MNLRTLRNPPLNIARGKRVEATQDSRVIMPGQRYRLETAADEREDDHLLLKNVMQRNWSRVGNGVLERHDGKAEACFVKQYIDRTGATHRDHLRYEYDGARVAASALGDIVIVPTLLLKDEQRLLNIFTQVELITVDELLREDEHAFWQYYPLLLDRLADVLAQLEASTTLVDTSSLPVKVRDYRSRGLALNFKGFEIRNTGYRLPLTSGNGNSPTTLPPVVMFDFVRPYLAPIEEAAAKLLISIGLLNWGKPLTRFIKGPDIDMLDMAHHYIGDWTHRDALEAELAIQRGFRFDAIKGANRSESGLKKIGLRSIGHRYLGQLGKWVENHYE